MVVDSAGNSYIWGEDASNLKIRQPELFHKFGHKVSKIALGKKHGIILDSEGSLFSWGDGTYGETGIISNFAIEKPTIIPYFRDKIIVSIAAGARHTVVLDNEGVMYAMGDNSEE